MTLAKVPDGRPVNNRYWVFAGGLTNVNVITVTDSLDLRFSSCEEM
jgi:hypothetical protein